MTNRKPYSTDISDPQWAILKSLIPAPKTGDRPTDKFIPVKEAVESAMKSTQARSFFG